ncbi:MAG: site-2 protease family protein [Candidatus Marsarchaeota archaeon]|jgi:membrane-associated protease RseP (regulator of RpoE activity)|nr:site-2 protease family protein [Candidatus Marsarchaeota archaeon]MCL5111427.1 site-2 protease family protein [Candidatus Marsarchaeota archaeon]
MAESMKSKAAAANAAVVAIFVIAFALLGLDYYASFLGLVNQVIAAIAILFISGMLVQRLKSLKGGYGLYMFGGSGGIKTVDSISKRNTSFWKQMPIWGIVLGFGLLSYPLLKGKVDKRLFAFSIVSLLLFLYFILPCTAVPLQFVNIPQLQTYAASAAAECVPSFSGLTLYGYFVYGVTLISGFSGFIIGSLLFNAANVLSNTISYALSVYAGAPQNTLLTNQIPGVAPVIPGIDIPLIAGIIALVIILTIHELSHGVLARMAKVKLKQIGVLLFGVIPIGAFVEPDEKAIEKLDKQKQNAISAAGISSNFIAAIVFFVLMLLMLLYVVPGIYQNKGIFVQSVLPNTPANGILSPGMQVLYWNGHKISDIASITAAGANDVPGSTVTVTAASPNCYPASAAACTFSNYTFTAIAINGSSKGYIGVSLYQKEAIASTAQAHALYFLYTVFALSFLLNFLVGIVNLLPIPGFDGWRIYKTNIKSEFFIRFVTGLILIGLVLNALPWLYIALLH